MHVSPGDTVLSCQPSNRKACGVHFAPAARKFVKFKTSCVASIEP
jgi:hypothetical protein